MLGAWETGVVGSGKQGRVQWTLKGKKKKQKSFTYILVNPVGLVSCGA